MKKVKSTIIILLITLIISNLFVVPALATELQSKEINLPDLSVSGQSEYNIVVPNFIEIKTVKVKLKSVTKTERYKDMKVIVMGLPEKDSHGNYPFFEVTTTNNDAHFISASINISNYDGRGERFYMAGYRKADFVDGKVMFDPSFKKGLDRSFEEEVGDLKDTSVDAIFDVDLYVFDKNGRNVFGINGEKLNFILVNNGTTTNTTKQSKTLAIPNASKVLVNGKEVSFEAYNINGNNYFKLRDLAMAVNGTDKNFEVGFDSTKNAISLDSGKAYTSAGGEHAVSATPESKDAKPTSSKIYLDGKEVQLTAYNIGGNNYFKLRDIAKAFNIGVTWDGKTSTVGIDTKIDYKDE